MRVYGVIVTTALFLLGFWYVRDIRQDAQHDIRIRQLQAEAERLAAERDSIAEIESMRADSLHETAGRIAELEASESRLDSALAEARGTLTEALAPAPLWTDTDSVLAVRTEEALADRSLDAVDVTPLRPTRFDVGRPLLVDYVHLVMTVLPAFRRVRDQQWRLLAERDSLIAEQRGQIAIQRRIIGDLEQVQALYGREIGRRERIERLYERQLTRAKRWRRLTVVAVGVGVGVAITR